MKLENFTAKWRAHSQATYFDFIKSISLKNQDFDIGKPNEEMQLPKTLEPITCPNPKCHRKIEEPILLSNLSTASAEQYYACPYCFIKLDVISTQPQKQEEGKEKKEEPLVEAPEKGEKGPSRCAGHFGYLATRPRNKPIPQECLTCPKVLECVMETSDS